MKSLGRLVSPEWIWINFYIHAGKNDWHVLSRELSEIYLTPLLVNRWNFAPNKYWDSWKFYCRVNSKESENIAKAWDNHVGYAKKCRWYRLLQELWEQSLKVWISRSRVDQGRCKRPHTLDSSWDWEVARPVSPLVTGCNPIQGNSSGWLAIQKLSHIKARILSKLSCENEFYLHAGMKQSVFFSKSVKKSVNCGVRVLRHATPRLVPGLLFDCSCVLEYAKIQTVLQSRLNLKHWTACKSNGSHLSRKECIWEIVIDTVIVFLWFV